MLTITPKEFIRRVLLHVPEQGQHMVRHYGLYAAAAKAKRAVCREYLGGLMNAVESKQTNTTAPLLCRDCGLELRWQWSVYPRRKKGNSYKVEFTGDKSEKRQVQQIDEPVIGQAKKKLMALRL